MLLGHPSVIIVSPFCRPYGCQIVSKSSIETWTVSDPNWCGWTECFGIEKDTSMYLSLFMVKIPTSQFIVNTNSYRPIVITLFLILLKYLQTHVLITHWEWKISCRHGQNVALTILYNGLWFIWNGWSLLFSRWTIRFI